MRAQRLRLQGDCCRALHRAAGLAAVLLQHGFSPMTPHSRMCFTKLTKYIAITLNEKTCLSVCRRQCPTERGDLLGTERGDLLSKVTRKHRLGLCLISKKSKFLPSARQELNRHEFQAAYDRRSLLNLGEIVDSQQEKFHCARAEELQRRDQQLLHERLLQQKLGITSSSPEKSH